VKLPLVGAAPGRPLCEAPGEHLYGSEVDTLRAMPGARTWLWRDGEGGLTEAMVRYAVRHEMARTIEDVLARRCRVLFLDAAQAAQLVDPVSSLLADELQREVSKAERSAFKKLALQYRALPD
ncbi:MAG TPA: glycerol-3-phosphate dehydrogenase C-terminal domain-containing protein, partial [Burkholderiaceae bacterium]|nr:glycerol-3-phosphate dehydrogenase C-terminal domain-containing protein [Burkholderiaceae bacterium]